MSSPAILTTENEATPPSTPSKKRKARGKNRTGSRPSSSPLLSRATRSSPSPLLSRTNKVGIGSKSTAKHKELKNSEDEEEEEDHLLTQAEPKKLYSPKKALQSLSPKKKGSAPLPPTILPPLTTSADANLILCTAEVHRGKSRTPSATSIDNMNYEEGNNGTKVVESVSGTVDNMPEGIDNFAEGISDLTQGIDNPAFVASDSGYALSAKVTMENTTDETTF